MFWFRDEKTLILRKDPGPKGAALDYPEKGTIQCMIKPEKEFRRQVTE